jgi:hypothetical protein
MEGSKRSLERFPTKAGVDMEIAIRVSPLSIQLFVNRDVEGVEYFSGENPEDEAGSGSKDVIRH